MPSGKKLYDIILHFNSVVKRIIINFLYYNIIPHFVRTHAQQRHAFCQIYTVICGFPPRRSRCFPTILYKKPSFCRFLRRTLSCVLKRKMQFLQNSFAIPHFADRTHILVTIYDTTQSPVCQCLYCIFTLKMQPFCVNIFHCCVYIFGFNAIIFIASLLVTPAPRQSCKQKPRQSNQKLHFCVSIRCKTLSIRLCIEAFSSFTVVYHLLPKNFVIQGSLKVPAGSELKFSPNTYYI